jgi:hypothetical protein
MASGDKFPAASAEMAIPESDSLSPKKKSRREFASMEPEQQHAIASKGGKA